jgi:hypothetical protein
MKINLEKPFDTVWKSGYLRLCNDGRKRVDLVNSNDSRTTISYAKYLMSVKLGYELPSDIEVDHKDNDKTNDDISNLQLLTSEENKKKQNDFYLENTQVSYGYECVFCGVHFILTKRVVNMRLAQNVVYAHCSKSCATKNNARLKARFK